MQVLDTFSIELCPTLLSSITEHRPSLSVFEASCRLLSSLLNKQAEGEHAVARLDPLADKVLSPSSIELRERDLASVLGQVYSVGLYACRAAADCAFNLCLGMFGRQCGRLLRLTGSLQCLRGLLLRSDQRAYDGVSRIIALFADPVLGVHAARTMSVLSKESDGVLTKSNHAIIRVRPTLLSCCSSD